MASVIAIADMLSFLIYWTAANAPFFVLSAYVYFMFP